MSLKWDGILFVYVSKCIKTAARYTSVQYQFPRSQAPAQLRSGEATSQGPSARGRGPASSCCTKRRTALWVQGRKGLGTPRPRGVAKLGAWSKATPRKAWAAAGTQHRDGPPFFASIDLAWQNALFLMPSFPVSDLALPAAVGRVPATTAGLEVRSGHAALRTREGFAAHGAHPQLLRARRVKYVAARQRSRRGYAQRVQANRAHFALRR
jgi:hypothetical protein